MPRLPPLWKKLIGFSLIGSGALSIISALVNTYAAGQLIEPPDEQSLGITRGDIFWWYGGLAVVGVALILAGWRVKK